MIMQRREFLKTAAATGLAALLLTPATVLADKTAVRIEAPAKAAVGDDITITLNVTHNGNNFFHYTDWVYLTANGKEVGRWDFTATQRPESENFTRTLTLTVQENIELTAKANCNLHGSAGETVHSLVVS